MLLSFSETSMLPYVRAGIRQALGEDVGDIRVKRQTIRRRGPRAERLLRCDPIAQTISLPLHLWWKSRTPKRELLGIIPAQLVRVYAMEIAHKPSGTCIYQLMPLGVESLDVAVEAFFDGFDSPEAFRDYFVPNPGDRFDAILFKW